MSGAEGLVARRARADDLAASILRFRIVLHEDDAVVAALLPDRDGGGEVYPAVVTIGGFKPSQLIPRKDLAIVEVLFAQVESEQISFENLYRGVSCPVPGYGSWCQRRMTKTKKPQAPARPSRAGSRSMANLAPGPVQISRHRCRRALPPGRELAGREARCDSQGDVCVASVLLCSRVRAAPTVGAGISLTAAARWPTAAPTTCRPPASL